MQSGAWNCSLYPFRCQLELFLLTEDLGLPPLPPPAASLDLIRAKPLTLPDYQISQAECNRLAFLIHGLECQPFSLVYDSHVNCDC